MKPIGKYVWLIKSLQEKDGMTFKEINAKWLHDHDNPEDPEYRRDIDKRTFRNHITAIKSEYGIVIRCDKDHGYKYYIDISKSDRDFYSTIERLSMLTVLNEVVSDSRLGNSLFMSEYFDLFRDNTVMTVMDAIKAKRKVSFENFKFPHKPEDKYRVLNIAPYQLHYICSKWYLIGEEDKLGMMRLPLSFYWGMANIKDESFNYPSYYSPEDYSMMIYGTTNNRVQLTIQIQDLHPERLNLSKYPLPFQQDFEYGYRDKEGEGTLSFLDKYYVRIIFDLPKTPFALYSLKNRIDKYSYTILNNKDPFTLFTEEQYLDAMSKPIVL